MTVEAAAAFCENLLSTCLSRIKTARNEKELKFAHKSFKHTLLAPWKQR